MENKYHESWLCGEKPEKITVRTKIIQGPWWIHTVWKEDNRERTTVCGSNPGYTRCSAKKGMSPFLLTSKQI